MGMGQPPSVMYKNKRAWTYDVEVHGYRYHLANLHAAVGVSQIEDFSKIKATRIDTVKYYNKNIIDHSLLEKPTLDKGIVPFIYYLRIKNSLREKFMEYLSKLYRNLCFLVSRVIGREFAGIHGAIVLCTASACPSRRCGTRFAVSLNRAAIAV